MKNFKIGLLALFCNISMVSFSQESDSVIISKIYSEALSNEWSYRVLEQLCKEAPHRLAGSEGSLKAVNLLFKKLQPIADTVYLQEVMAKRWSRGKQEEAMIISGGKSRKIPALSLGGSISTGNNGIKAKVIEVNSLEELKKFGKANIEGKIVFFNHAMDPLDMSPGRQYGKNVWQRFSGAKEAAVYGATATVIRSLSNSLSEYPHTGIMRYEDSIPKIPAITISTMEANNLSRELKQNPDLEFFMHTWCQSLPEVKSYNVIAEIKGSTLAEEVITVGGHIDSWDTGEGAHDDGAGCVHSMEALRLIKHLGIKTKRTIRVVLFMDEEMNQVGGKKYAEWVKFRNENIYAAIESDSGGALPVGFACSANEKQYAEFLKLKFLLEPYGVTRFRAGGGGVDIEFLEEMQVPLLNLVPEPQRYFEFHHSANDKFEKISFRELQMGSATIASMIVMLDLKDVFN